MSIGDEATSETLRRYAEECDARATAIEAREVLFETFAQASR